MIEDSITKRIHMGVASSYTCENYFKCKIFIETLQKASITARHIKPTPI